MITHIKKAGVTITVILLSSNVYANSTIFLSHDVKHDESQPLRNLPQLQLPLTKKVIPLLTQPFDNISTYLHDDALQTRALTIPPFSFKTYVGMGVGLGNYFPSFAPPDANIAVGLTQIMQYVNADIAVFDKKTGAVLAGFPRKANSVFAGFGGLCETTNAGDGLVKYDRISNRWIISQFANTGDAADGFFQCVAVSKTADATGVYYRYAFQFNDFNDYPKLGVWADAYYLTANMYGLNYLGPMICALDKKSMQVGAHAATQCVQLEPTYRTTLPADADGLRPVPAKAPGLFTSMNNFDSLYVWKFFVDWTDELKSRLIGPTTLTVANFTFACFGGACIEQPQTTTVLESVSDRLMYRLAYRQFPTYGSMVVNHSIRGPNSDSAIRWYELRISNDGQYTPTLYQQGTYSPNANYRFVGSIAMDKIGDIALGYSLSSATVFPSIAITGRLASDARGLMGNEQVMVPGLGSQTNDLSRWGDYTSMVLDPSDDCTFWYVNQYQSYSSYFNWSTSIGKFKFANCVGTKVPV